MHAVRIIHCAQSRPWREHVCGLRAQAACDLGIEPVAIAGAEDIEHALGDTEPALIVVGTVEHVHAVRAALARRDWTSRLVVVWTAAWPEQMEHYCDALEHADLIVFTSRVCWMNVGCPPGTMHLPFGVDLDAFTCRLPIEERPRRVLWAGARNAMEADTFERVVWPLKQRLEASGYDCDFRLEERHGALGGPDETAEWLNSGQVFVTTGATEDAMGMALGAAACGMAVVSAQAGDISRIIRHEENGIVVERRHADAFFDAIHHTVDTWPELASTLRRDVQSLCRRKAADEHLAAYRAAIELGRERRHGNGHRRNGNGSAVATGCEPLDLSDEVTVFVSSVGAATRAACLELLGRQDCRFRFEIIEDVAPMSAAFQHMLDACTTPFYVQVDEDMLLYPHAVRTLHERMKALPDEVAIHGRPLYDLHLKRPVNGVKLFRHEVVRDYAYRDLEAFELDQISRLKQDGYAYVTDEVDAGADPSEAVLGLHGSNFTPATAYVRYYTLQLRQRTTPTDSWKTLLAELGDAFRASPSEVNFFALAGALAGKLAPLDSAPGARNYLDYDRTRGFAEARRVHALFKAGDI